MSVLDWRNRQLKLDTKADIEPLLNGIDPLKVEEIHLCGNTLGVEAAQVLSEFLQKATSIKLVNFADIFTGRLITEIPLALTTICDALKDKTSLVELDLSDNAFGGRSVDPIVPFLTENRSFQILKLNNNGLGPAGGATIATALLESARLSQKEGKKSNLRVVICGRNRLEDGSAPVWAEAFKAHGSLVEVRMPQNGIRMKGITALAEGLSHNASLEYIDLQDNTFTEDGALTGLSAWTEALPKWDGLTFLNLSDCFLSSDGEVPSLVTALVNGSNSKLHTLQLQNNNLDTQTFELIAGGIGVGSGLGTLMKLDLLDNDMEEEDEHLETIAMSMKQRGGKLYATDEDEEEEGEVDEEERALEEQTEIKVPGEAEGPGLDAKDKTMLDKAADALADLMGKVSLNSN